MSLHVLKHYKTVLTQADQKELLTYIDTGLYYAVDTETNGLNPRKCKLIGLSLSGEVGRAYYIPTYTWQNNDLEKVSNNEEFLYEVLNILKTKQLVMFNGSFDIRVILSNFGIDLTESLYSDVMLMKHTIQEDGIFSLKGIAIEYKDHIGIDAEKEANEEQLELKENIKKNGGSTTKTNYEMYKADLNVMAKYASADADLTMRLALFFNSVLYKEGLDSFFYDEEVMPLYKKVTIPMDMNGVKLDIPLMQKTKEEITKRMEELKAEINAEFEALGEFSKWVEDYCSEEFPPKPSGSFFQLLCKELDLFELLKNGKYSTAKAMVEKLKDDNIKQFIQTADHSFIDKNVVIKIQKQLLKEKNESDYLINISSKNQMAEFVFKYLKLKPLSFTEKGNAPQFDDDFLQSADKDGHSWARKIGNYNKLLKIRSTYIDRFLEAQEDGRYYFTYKQHGTISGRYSGDAQQLPRPKEEGQLDPDILHFTNLIRTFFIADEGRIFIDCDYESLEPHVFADVAGDDGLKDIFRKGHDFYSTIAIKTEKLQGVSADKKAENYLGKINKQARQNAKAYCLGVPYGMTGYALGKTLGISTEEAEKLVEGYLSGFPKLREWMEKSKTFVTACGFIKTKAGRVRHLPKAKEVYEKYGDDILDYKFRAGLIKKMKSRGIYDAEKRVLDMYLDYKNSVNNGYNSQIQGFGASIVNRAAIEINKEFKAKGIDGKVVAQIHDQIIMDVPESKKEECAAIIKDKMENTTKLSIDLKAPPSYSINWRDGH